MEWKPDDVISAVYRASVAADRNGQRLNISTDAAKIIMDVVVELSERRISALEVLVRHLLEARENGVSLSDMQAMAREAGVDL